MRYDIAVLQKKYCYILGIDGEKNINQACISNVASTWEKDKLEQTTAWESIFQNRDQQTTSTRSIVPTACFSKCFVERTTPIFILCYNSQAVATETISPEKACYRKFIISHFRSSGNN